MAYLTSIFSLEPGKKIPSATSFTHTSHDQATKHGARATPEIGWILSKGSECSHLDQEPALPVSLSALK
ncbi:hypothetical protein OPQ81_000616 [Rhizoctonia solani]|nr:hypothetical protein OPQ81_000616 [Rhizoctonia solani]